MNVWLKIKTSPLESKVTSPWGQLHGAHDNCSSWLIISQSVSLSSSRLCEMMIENSGMLSSGLPCQQAAAVTTQRFLAGSGHANTIYGGRKQNTKTSEYSPPAHTKDALGKKCQVAQQSRPSLGPRKKFSFLHFRWTSSVKTGEPVMRICLWSSIVIYTKWLKIAYCFLTCERFRSSWPVQGCIGGYQIFPLKRPPLFSQPFLTVQSTHHVYFMGQPGCWGSTNTNVLPDRKEGKVVKGLC